MEIRLHALHGMHFIIYHYDHPIQTRSFSSAHKNTKTIAQLYKNVHWPWRAFSKKCAFGSLCTDAPSTKKNGEIDSLSPRLVCIGDRRFHWIHVEGRSNRTKHNRLQTKAYTWRRGRIYMYAPLLFALNNTNSRSSIISFLPALQNFTAEISILDTFNGELFSLKFAAFYGLYQTQTELHSTIFAICRLTNYLVLLSGR